MLFDEPGGFWVSVDHQGGARLRLATLCDHGKRRKAITGVVSRRGIVSIIAHLVALPRSPVAAEPRDAVA